MKKKRMPMHWKILIGMSLGVIAGLVLSQFNWGPSFVRDWIKPFGNIFINALKLIAVPLIIASLIKGVSDLKDLTNLSKMGFRTVFTFILTTVAAVSIGLLLVSLIKPGASISSETRTDLLYGYETEASTNINKAVARQDTGPLQGLVDIVPENFMAAAADNRNMLQVIFFALFIGVGLILIPAETAKPVKDFFDGFNEVILKMIDIIMLSAPYGVFALLAALIIDSPSIDLFAALGMYALTVVLGLILMLGVYGLMLYLFTKRSPLAFYRAIAPAQLLAFSTSSSAATLPVTMERVTGHLGVPKEVASFVLPVGATINMDGTSLYQAVAAVFIAQAFGLDLSLGTQLGIIATATLASIGSAAVPGAGMVMLVIVLAQAGIPEAGLALIFGVDRPLDMCRTVVNVSGDAAVSGIVAKSVSQVTESLDVVPKFKP
ncbi:dicarboxylate/amino acid:cation symporter [Salinimicrobium tongyeongense]|nr:dicarboxylate/amino acid:cation symporter [Salinimicrobium tongyeongense]